MQCLWLLLPAIIEVTVGAASQARAQIPLSYGRGLGLRDALKAVSKDEDLQYADLSSPEKAEGSSSEPPLGDVPELSRELAGLQAKLSTMKKMELLQTAETKAAVASLEEKLLMAEERASEEQGELEVSEAHGKDLAQQLEEEMSKRKRAEEQLVNQNKVPKLEQKSVSFLQVIEDDVAGTQSSQSQSQVSEQKLAKLLEDSETQVPDEADLAMVALAAEGTKTQTSQAETVGKKLKATSEMVQQLQVEKQDLQLSLSKQQEAVDKAKLDIRRRTESVKSLKARSANLEQLLSNMDQADAASVRKAEAESDRVKGYLVEMNAEMSKTILQKQELDARVAEAESQRRREEERAKKQVEQTRQIAVDVEQANAELKKVNQEILKTKERISQEEAKATNMKNQIEAEQQAHEARQKQMAELKAEFDGKKQEVSSMMQKYQNLVRKAKAAKALLTKEEQKAKEQAQKANEDLDDERVKAQEQATHDAAALETAKRHVQEETEKTESDFKKQVELIRKKHEDEVKKAEQKILKEVKIQKDQMTAKVASYQRQLVQEEKKEKTEASIAVAKEAELQRALKKTKQEEKKKLEEYNQEMKHLEQNLDDQKKVSTQKIEQARRDVQGLQREVLEEQEALKTKQAALQREQEQASEMMERAAQEEKLEATKERELQEKVQEAVDMEEKGKLVLQRQAKAQVAKLRKMISDEEALEKEQVEALKKQIAEAKSRSFLQKL